MSSVEPNTQQFLVYSVLLLEMVAVREILEIDGYR